MKNLLIQRAKFKDIAKKDVVGIDCLLRLDYMGSAEFEFGALPQSLNWIAGSLDVYDRFSTEFKVGEDTVHIICKKDDEQVVKDVLEFLSRDEYPRNNNYWSKENTRFKSALEGNDHTRCWWDVNNHWFACVGKANVEKLMIGLKAFKERKGL